MKKRLLGIFLIMLGFSLTGCNKDDANVPEKNETIYVENEIIDNLKNAVRVDIRELTEDKIVGTITDSETINELIDAISTSSYSGSDCLADAHQMELEMYDENDNLLDTIDFWPNIERIRPENSSNNCYFNVQGENTVKNIIESETDYKF
ncbi:MAG TPA: hypothetical protein IAB40_05150 [Candidatus Onthocola stercoravium]|nr:hypothetical protein [Candidatus Onthocola stercoravium]